MPQIRLLWPHNQRKLSVLIQITLRASHSLRGFSNHLRGLSWSHKELFRPLHLEDSPSLLDDTTGFPEGISASQRASRPPSGLPGPTRRISRPPRGLSRQSKGSPGPSDAHQASQRTLQASQKALSVLGVWTNNERTFGRNFSSFYRTFSSTGVAAQKG